MTHETSFECCRLFSNNNGGQNRKVFSKSWTLRGVSSQSAYRWLNKDQTHNTAGEVVVVEAGDNVTYARSNKCGSGGIGRRARFRI